MDAPTPARPAHRAGGARLTYLDGLRGLACLYVLLFHATTLITTRRRLLPRPLGIFSAVVSRGHFGVVVFIVLSGFSLMLPVARSADSELPGGLRAYVRRRARRIAPPYYAALALSIAVIAAYNVVGPRIGLGSRVPAADLSPGSIVSHLFLVQNVSSAWVNRINGPMWSVATEWQIYFLFALLLLPLARRLSIFVVVAGAWVVSSLPFFVLPYGESLSWAYPWMVGAFALGMLGATIGFGSRFRTSRWRAQVPWGLVCLAAFIIVVVLVATGRADTWPAPVVDLCVSILAVAIINACWYRDVPGLLNRFLSSRFLVFIGGFSYSLYLFQDIVLKLTQKVFVKAGVTPTAGVVGHLLIVVPGTIAGAWLFAEFFERPFTGSATLLPALRRWAIARRENPGTVTPVAGKSPAGERALRPAAAGLAARLSMSPGERPVVRAPLTALEEGSP